MAAFAAALALAIIWLVVQPGASVASMLTCAIVIAAVLLMLWRTRQLSRARNGSAHIMTALGAATVDIPVRLRTRMPLVLVTGDALAALFDRGEAARFVHVGAGAIWLRAERPNDLPRLAVAVKQWRDGRAPDGIVLAVAPAFHADTEMLAQSLRVVRQAASDAARLLGTRHFPGYIAVYQRLSTEPASPATPPQWYGVSSAVHMTDSQRFDTVIRAAENEVRHATDNRVAATRAAALASIAGWTQRVVIAPLADQRQPAAPWALFGAGWIDCGPASGVANPWERDVQMQTCVTRAAATASPTPWPLPQPLIGALPVRLWMPPRMAALAHAIVLLACAAAVAFVGSARNNAALLARVDADLARYASIPAARDAARRDALHTLVTDRDELDRYARTGIPLRLSFGMYRGAQMIPALNDAIASYAPPPPLPAVVTLDSMSLFDSGKAQLKDGSTRAMVEALDMIKQHPGKRILVAGHTDNVGTPSSNLKLSTARAEAVRAWLIEASGMASTHFAIQGYGDTHPVADNETEAGRAKNRRVEITLVPDAAHDMPMNSSVPLSNAARADTNEAVRQIFAPEV
ncbi:OmpA family protein [Paraburkholderia sp.]|uniref:OmpA family protein n=1 Tax=Paraburkholderia sp. TaxID=1926495 RepID=UPI0025DAB499|nr:OmpA family protein [Paraburkholderia sp.]